MKVRLSFSFFLFFFKTGFLCVALTVLELTLQTRLALNSEIRLPLPPVGKTVSYTHLTRPTH